MSDKPVALLVTPVLPLPRGSGRALRAWEWLKELSETHCVHIITPDTDHAGLSSGDYPAAKIWTLSAAPPASGRWQRAAGLILPGLALVSRRFVLDWHRPTSSTLLQALSASLSGGTVERIIVFRLYLHDVGLTLSCQFPAASLELDCDDLESSTRRSVAAALLRMGKYRAAWRTLSSALQYRLLEGRISKQYKKIYLAAREDCVLQRKESVIPFDCRPNRIAVPRDFPPAHPGKPFRLLFVGTLNYPPNEEAVLKLIKNLVPLLNATVSGLWELTIVGRHASHHLTQQLEKAPAHVQWLDNVDDLTGIYAESHCILVPLKAGGGTKLKTLEGFAHRRPVVSTQEGVRGLNAINGTHYLQAETMQEFALAIQHLIKNPAIANQIGLAGWSLCKEKYCAR